MKQLIGICLFAFVCLVGNCQYYYYNNKYYDKNVIAEFGISVNAMNSITDIGGKTVDLKNFRFGGGVYTSVMYQDIIGARLELTYGSVGASDKNATGNRPNERGIQARNLSFKSDIQELSLLAEFHPLNIKYRPDGLPALSPYLLAGIGFFNFNPEANLNGQWIFLQPLHTEGEGFAETGRPNYRLSQINFQAGGGLKYELNELVTLRGEAIYRILNTDYLDDVSTTYIDPALFDKYLSPANAALAKKLYWRTPEINPNAVAPVSGTHRGSNKRDAFYSINIKIGIALGRTTARRF